MKRQHVNYLVVGLVCFALFGLLAIVLFKITGRTGPTDSYHIYYSSVAGLNYGTPVFYEGYLVGQVEAVTPVRTEAGTRFRVDVTLERGWDVPVDSRAAISTGLLSGVAIDIREGNSPEVLSPGSEIPGEDTVGFMVALNDLANDMRDLSASHIRPMIERLSGSLDAISGELNDEVPSLVEDVRTLVTRLNQSAAHLEELLSDDNRQSVGVTVQNLEQVSEKLQGLANDLTVAGGQVRAMVRENRPALDASVNNMQLSFETLAQRLDSVGYQLEAATRNLNEFTREIRNNPSLLISSKPKDETEERP